MNEHDLLDIVGQAQDAYILRAASTRKEKRPLRLSRRLLIAAVVVMLLVLTACGAKYVSGLFASYFHVTRGESLHDSQIAYIAGNTQPTIAQTAAADTENGYSIQVTSALTDGRVAYITVEIQGPETASLEGGQIRFLQEPKLYPETEDSGLILDGDGVSPYAMGNYLTVEDGDGLANTASLVFSVNPLTKDHGIKPFDGSLKWRAQFSGFEKLEYPGHEKPPVEVPLTEGNWEFDLTFQELDTREVQFVGEPVLVKTSDVRQEVYDKENQIESFLLSSLTYKMVLTEPEIKQKSQEVGEITIVMQDGTCQTVFHPSAYSNRLPVPIVVGEVAYLLLKDGTKLYPQE